MQPVELRQKATVWQPSDSDKAAQALLRLVEAEIRRPVCSSANTP